MGANEYTFRIGNKAAEKWTLEEVEKIFFEMRENAEKNNNILCVQDAIKSVDLYSSSVNYLLEKFPVFENLKKDIQQIIIARINRKALEGDFNATASIWRFKQLGESDKQEIDHTTKGNAISISPIQFKKTNADD